MLFNFFLFLYFLFSQENTKWIHLFNGENLDGRGTAAREGQLWGWSMGGSKLLDIGTHSLTLRVSANVSYGEGTYSYFDNFL